MTFDGKTAFTFLKSGYRVRMSTWYWGKYIAMRGQAVVDEKGHTYPKTQFMDGATINWEKYNEDEHGEHNGIGSNLECSGGCGEQPIS